jgi:hypothetical protein
LPARLRFVGPEVGRFCCCACDNAVYVVAQRFKIVSVGYASSDDEVVCGGPVGCGKGAGVGRVVIIGVDGVEMSVGASGLR